MSLQAVAQTPQKRNVANIECRKQEHLQIRSGTVMTLLVLKKNNHLAKETPFRNY